MTNDVNIEKPKKSHYFNSQTGSAAGKKKQGVKHALTLEREKLLRYEAYKKLSYKAQNRLKTECGGLFWQIVHDAFTSPVEEIRIDAAKNFGKYLVSEAPKELLANVNEAITVNILYNNELAKKEIAEATYKEIGSEAVTEKKRPVRPKKLRQGDQGENSGES